MRYFLTFFLFGLIFLSTEGSSGPRLSSIALHDFLKYPPSFEHLDYANPAAPKGGALRLAATGTYDSLSSFSLKGTPVIGLERTFATLLGRTRDDLEGNYAYLAEFLEISDDFLSVTFYLRKNATFHDGTPILAKDVVASFNALKEEGSPAYRSAFKDILFAAALTPHQVKFRFAYKSKRNLAILIGKLPVLSARDLESRSLEEAALSPFLGSGPYKISNFTIGRSVTYERIKNWWGETLPLNKGRFNFDIIQYDYYRDPHVAFEAFKVGGYDLRQELSAKNWETAYNFPAVQEGKVLLKTIDHKLPTGMPGLFFNTRRPQFKNRKVRKALLYAFDFEWINKNLFYNTYKRTESYFTNTDYAAVGTPTKAELKILKPYQKEIPPEVFKASYEAPVNNGYGLERAHLQKAKDLLEDAGWVIKNQRLTNQETGKSFTLEILLNSSGQEKYLYPFLENLSYLGIEAKIRVVDPLYFEQRIAHFDFDIASLKLPDFTSPGPELYSLFSSRSAHTPGSLNYAGIENPIVDGLIEGILTAHNRQELINNTRALDRVLLFNHYVIPRWHTVSLRFAYWNKFSFPKTPPEEGIGLNAWWYDEEKARALEESK